jgi:hypothetical protein
MRARQMHRLGHQGCHQCAPREWRRTPIVSGDYDLDQTILHRSNKDLPHRLELYAKRPAQAYGPRSAYSGYDGYHGDD